LVLVALALMGGCAGPAPIYSPSIDNVEAIKKAGTEPLRTGLIAVAPGLKTGNSITLRADSMVPAEGGNFGDYISAALRQELQLAKLYNPQSPLEISGTLLENDINAGGFSTADGVIAVRFVVKRGQQVLYDKDKKITHQWENSFVGAVAIPLAKSNYPIMVQKLIALLVADSDFGRALAK
jgi:hypothetical protein